MSDATHRHKKRGTSYVFVGYGTYVSTDSAGDDADLYVHEVARGVWHVRWAFGPDVGEWARAQCAASIRNGDVVAIYRGEDGFVWVRPREEFEDGRFEALT